MDAAGTLEVTPGNCDVDQVDGHTFDTPRRETGEPWSEPRTLSERFREPRPTAGTLSRRFLVRVGRVTPSERRPDKAIGLDWFGTARSYPK
jgi:hypothetical protein